MNIRISTKGKRPMRSLAPSDKVHAIQRIHDGESKASVARDIGVPESTLRGWCKNEDKLRFLSRQAAAEKINEPLSVKFENSPNGLSAPSEKRQRVDTSMVLNFSNKIKFDEVNAFKRAQVNGLDFGSTKALTDLSSFSTLSPDYGPYNGASKSKFYGADVSRSVDPSIADVSPLSNLTNLSGLTGMSQSPLSISFSELTSNLSLLAQLNTGITSLPGVSGLSSARNTLRNTKQKQQPQGHSPLTDHTGRQSGLTVKNWAKQKLPSPNSIESSFGMHLSQNDGKVQMKIPGGHLAPPNQVGTTLPAIASLQEDPVLYWLKSQQAILGLNNMYSLTSTLGEQSAPVRSSTPQQQRPLAGTPPIIPSPSRSFDDKNSAWFSWCKAFGASLNSLSPAAAMVALQTTSAPNNVKLEENTGETNPLVQNEIIKKSGFQNILYSQLTKDCESSQSSPSSQSPNRNKTELKKSDKLGTRSDDHSPISTKVNGSEANSLPNIAINSHQNESSLASAANSHVPAQTINSKEIRLTRNSVAECRDVLDNLLYKINCNADAESILDEVECSNISNKDPDKGNEEDWEDNNLDCIEELDDDYTEAIKHGEKFLHWLEKCGDTRVTAVQMMQLRYLISSIKRDNHGKCSIFESAEGSLNLNTIETDDSCEAYYHHKVRRRK